MSVSVLLADAHQVFREGLRELLHASNKIRVIADVSNGDDAIRLISNQEIDIAIVDVFLSGMSTEEMITRTTREKRKTTVIVLSATQSQRHVHGAIRAGAGGYLSKTASGTELLEAIDAVQGGNRYLCSDLTQRLVAAFGISTGPHAPSGYALTDRECEILRLIAEGCSSKEIATHLGLQINTVESHRHRLMNKLGIHKTANLVHFAIREGIATA